MKKRPLAPPGSNGSSPRALLLDLAHAATAPFAPNDGRTTFARERLAVAWAVLGASERAIEAAGWQGEPTLRFASFAGASLAAVRAGRLDTARTLLDATVVPPRPVQEAGPGLLGLPWIKALSKHARALHGVGGDGGAALRALLASPPNAHPFYEIQELGECAAAQLEVDPEGLAPTLDAMESNPSTAAPLPRGLTVSLFRAGRSRDALRVAGKSWDVEREALLDVLLEAGAFDVAASLLALPALNPEAGLHAVRRAIALRANGFALGVVTRWAESPVFPAFLAEAEALCGLPERAANRLESCSLREPPGTWRNVACAWAVLGDRARAIEAVESFGNAVPQVQALTRCALRARQSDPEGVRVYLDHALLLARRGSFDRVAGLAAAADGFAQLGLSKEATALVCEGMDALLTWHDKVARQVRTSSLAHAQLVTGDVAAIWALVARVRLPGLRNLLCSAVAEGYARAGDFAGARIAAERLPTPMERANAFLDAYDAGGG